MKKDAQNEEKLIAKEKLYKIKLAKKNLKNKDKFKQNNKDKLTVQRKTYNRRNNGQKHA